MSRFLLPRRVFGWALPSAPFENGVRRCFTISIGGALQTLSSQRQNEVLIEGLTRHPLPGWRVWEGPPPFQRLPAQQRCLTCSMPCQVQRFYRRWQPNGDRDDK
jgi:hypothetical protein